MVREIICEAKYKKKICENLREKKLRFPKTQQQDFCQQKQQRCNQTPFP
jgi:hypothetical protein